MRWRRLPGKDPYSSGVNCSRIAPTSSRCSTRWSEKGDWGKPMPAGKGRGIAIHESYNSIVGMIAEVAVANGELKVERVVIACDCGHVVNPRSVEMQLEGGMIYGLSAALFGEITVKNGRVEQGNFDTYPVVRLKDAPKTEVCISRSPAARNGAASASPARP